MKDSDQCGNIPFLSEKYDCNSLTLQICVTAVTSKTQLVFIDVFNFMGVRLKTWGNGPYDLPARLWAIAKKCELDTYSDSGSQMLFCGSQNVR